MIPFLIMLLLVGFPLMLMELAFGQFASLGPIAIFERFCPLFHGKLSRVQPTTCIVIQMHSLKTIDLIRIYRYHFTIMSHCLTSFQKDLLILTKCGVINVKKKRTTKC